MLCSMKNKILESARFFAEKQEVDKDDYFPGRAPKNLFKIIAKIDNKKIISGDFKYPIKMHDTDPVELLSDKPNLGNVVNAVEFSKLYYIRGKKKKHEKHGLGSAIRIASFLFAFDTNCKLIMTENITRSRKGIIYEKLGLKKISTRMGPAFQRLFPTKLFSLIKNNDTRKIVSRNMLSKQGAEITQILSVFSELATELKKGHSNLAKGFLELY